MDKSIVKSCLAAELPSLPCRELWRWRQNYHFVTLVIEPIWRARVCHSGDDLTLVSMLHIHTEPYSPLSTYIHTHVLIRIPGEAWPSSLFDGCYA